MAVEEANNRNNMKFFNCCRQSSSSPDWVSYPDEIFRPFDSTKYLGSCSLTELGDHDRQLSLLHVSAAQHLARVIE